MKLLYNPSVAEKLEKELSCKEACLGGMYFTDAIFIKHYSKGKYQPSRRENSNSSINLLYSARIPSKRKDIIMGPLNPTKKSSKYVA